ncbi:MAG TPA: AAA family ATPase, partial [Pseudomonadales bacterium]|nr:AAA family ATPase [Pseudomonadales bacterium]
MLHHLSIRNYTLIPALDLDLDEGLTVVTGETGAGKSIVLDALGLALGNRADSRAIRAGAERLEVSAGFDLRDTPAAAAWLAERELDDAGECQLRRVVTRDGRSRAWINGRPATLQDIKELGDLLVDIHGQHEHHSLLARASQQRLMDEYGEHLPLLRRVAAACGAWRACHDELAALRTSSREREDRAQLLAYQLGELDELALMPNECEALEQEQRWDEALDHYGAS